MRLRRSWRSPHGRVARAARAPAAATTRRRRSRTASRRSSRRRRWCSPAATATSRSRALRWPNWGAATATADGTARANDCDPYCAAGTFRTYPVDVTASGLQTCVGGRRQYTRLEWSTQAKPPPGQANPPGEMSFPCTWTLHPGLSASRANGTVVLAGEAWTRGASCPPKVTLTTAGRKIATVAVSARGTFSYAWRAPAGQHVVVARVDVRRRGAVRGLARPPLGPAGRVVQRVDRGRRLRALGRGRRRGRPARPHHVGRHAGADHASRGTACRCRPAASRGARTGNRTSRRARA